MPLSFAVLFAVGVQGFPMNVHLRMHACIRVLLLDAAVMWSARLPYECAFAYACMHTQMRRCIYISVCLCACVCICVFLVPSVGSVPRFEGPQRQDPEIRVVVPLFLHR